MKTQHNWFIFGENFLNFWEMRAKTFLIYVVIPLGFLNILIASLFFFLSPTNQKIIAGIKYCFSASSVFILFFATPENQILKDYVREAFDYLFSQFMRDLFFGMAVWLLAPKIISWLQKNTDKQLENEHVSGSKLVSVDALNEQTNNENCGFSIGGIRVPVKNETTHFLIPGASGRGKTQVLKPIIQTVKRRANVKGIINDIKGDWTSEFYYPEKGDIIFNPLDTRSVKWTIFNDIHDEVDITNFATWLIPELPGKDPFWQNSARMILAAVLRLCFYTKATNENFKLICSYSSPLLAGALEQIDSKAAELAAKRDSYLTFVTYVQFAQFLSDGDFSITKWIEGGNGFIFLPNQPKYTETFRPLLTLFVNVAASHLLSLTDSPTRRVFFFLDEFTSLAKMPEIVKVANLGRSKGASLFLTLQNFEQLEEIYGKEANALIENTSNVVAFGLNHPKSAEFVADRLGKSVQIFKTQSFSMGIEDNRDGLNLTEQRKEENVVRAGDILNLPPLVAYVKLDGIDGIAQVKIVPITVSKVAQGFAQMPMPQPIIKPQGDLESIVMEGRGVEVEQTEQNDKEEAPNEVGEKPKTSDTVDELDVTRESNDDAGWQV